MLAATDGKYSLFVLPDDYPLNPRKDYEPFGRMICWHPRYDLGDDHEYEEPADLLRDLYRESIHDGGRRLFQFVKSGAAKSTRLVYNRSSHEWDLEELWNWRSGPCWEHVCSGAQKDFLVGGCCFDDLMKTLEQHELEELLEEKDSLLLLPLYLYDHSVLSISTSSFIGRAQHAEWDSGQVGVIYATRDMIQKEFGAINPETLEKARKLLVAEVESYDLYLRGICFGYRLFEDADEIDACWGFLGWFEDLKEDIRGYLPDECAALIDKLESTDISEEAYLLEHLAILQS